MRFLNFLAAWVTLTAQAITGLRNFFHRRSLSFSMLALLLSALAASHGPGFAFRMSPPSASFALRAVVLFVVAFMVCIHATINLIRDVERGYSPGRCSLAAVVLLLAFALSTLFGSGMVGFILHEREVLRL